MAYSNAFVDSDVLLDLALFREPFYPYTQLLLHRGESGRLKLNTSSLVIANMNYILSKKLGASKAKDVLKAVKAIINILPFEDEAIDSALTGNIIDFEDAIQCFIAKKFGCDVIVTRNIKDYKQSTIPVLTPEQFLKIQ
jgi:predicted nucleic acid-binding protein